MRNDINPCGTACPGQIAYLWRLGTMMGFLIPRARPREELPQDDSTTPVVSCYISSFARAARAFTLGRQARLTAWWGSKGARGLARRMETPVCVHKHVREPLCKFLNTMGPYILRLCQGAKNKISIATNVSRLKRPLGSDIRVERVARVTAEESTRPCVRLNFEPRC